MALQSKELIEAWRSSAELHSLYSAATEYELRLAESTLGHRLPMQLRDLYLFGNQLDLLSGNLNIFPLEETGERLGLTSASAKLRDWHWQIPTEVLIFGDNGSDEHFGIWIPETRGSVFAHPVLEVGEIFEPHSMAIMATELMPFLFGWTAYYLMLYEASAEALDVIGLPQSLRFNANDMDDDVFAKLRQWSDPKLPDPNPNPYQHGYDAEGLKRLFAN